MGNYEATVGPFNQHDALNLYLKSPDESFCWWIRLAKDSSGQNNSKLVAELVETTASVPTNAQNGLKIMQNERLGFELAGCRLGFELNLV